MFLKVREKNFFFVLFLYFYDWFDWILEQKMLRKNCQTMSMIIIMYEYFPKYIMAGKVFLLPWFSFFKKKFQVVILSIKIFGLNYLKIFFFLIIIRKKFGSALFKEF